ncbi:Leucine-rich repeat typical subtype [Penicillium alfredii]|uniref:Leucine-rich repeat typical subtype n=1 Tax=Penicillium alfredii TaxID=1506179 RepID=A0A9W9F8K4_9EURO|nr:Leucine-rich repeat typical subtype [Penicillium alfredii]KAJ5095643.1 Leucine-rich repeat typical subtype [Penicillium alfredii]
MDGEIPLPPPRRIRHRSPAHATSHAGTGSGSVASSFHKSRRLSRFDDRSSQPSSEPPLFSSDDIPASGVENYHAPVSTGAGRKRRYRGTWWGEQVIDPKRKRADFKEKRHVDSGVWMGSDESAAESFLSSEDGSAWGEDLLKTALNLRATAKSAAAPASLPAQSKTAFKRPEEPAEHRLARTVVADCLEKGQDSIDLGNLHLRTIPSGLLQPLQHLTKLPTVGEAPVSENVFTSLQPFLRIFLPNNSLSLLHHELFELADLKVLSVRNNKLTEISPTIRRLTALQVLNVSVNRLSYLPWELLWLVQQGELKHLTARPNSFLAIEEAQIAAWSHRSESKSDKPSQDPLQFREYEGSPPAEAWAPIHIATGPTKWLNMEGNPTSDNLSPSTIKTPAESSGATSAPSFREIALRAVSKLPYLEHVSDAELAEYPAMVVPLLRQAREVRIAGGQPCSVCGQEYVIPRTEWLEWWDCSPCENGMKGPRSSGEKLRPLPFRRFGCSVHCVLGS